MPIMEFILCKLFAPGISEARPAGAPSRLHNHAVSSLLREAGQSQIGATPQASRPIIRVPRRSTLSQMEPRVCWPLATGGVIGGP